MYKQILRKTKSQERSSMNKQDVFLKSRQIITFLEDVEEYENANVICVYVSRKNEVHTHAFIRKAIAIGKTVAVPKVTGEILKLGIITNFENLVVTSHTGLLEPKTLNEIDVHEIDLFVVPGLVFGIRKQRIGYGKGYYDRLLQEYKGTKVGICFDIQLINSSEGLTEVFDVDMDFIITEKRIIK